MRFCVNQNTVLKQVGNNWRNSELHTRIVVDLVPEEVHWSRHGSASQNHSRYKELMIVHQDSVCQDSTLMHVLHTIHKTNNIEITVVHQIDIGKSNRE